MLISIFLKTNSYSYCQHKHKTRRRRRARKRRRFCAYFLFTNERCTGLTRRTRCRAGLIGGDTRMYRSPATSLHLTKQQQICTGHAAVPTHLPTQDVRCRNDKSLSGSAVTMAPSHSMRRYQYRCGPASRHSVMTNPASRHSLQRIGINPG